MEKQKRDREVEIEPKKILREEQDPMRLRLKKLRCVDLDENLKRIYRIKN